MLTTHIEPTLDDWDITIERAQQEPLAEPKLIRTIDLLVLAQQRSRLRGDIALVSELGSRINLAHELLDQL